MPDEHARLSPSAAERWVTCPASVQLGETFPEQAASIYAEEGTAAHSLAELELSKAFKKIGTGQYLQRFKVWRDTTADRFGSDAVAEMKRYVEGFVVYVQEAAAEYADTVAFFEKRLTKIGVEACWGTSDVTLVSPEHVHIIDFKYGRGVSVRAHDNPQIMLYGVGALEEYGDLMGETKIVKMSIYQPRVGAFSTFSLTPYELRLWRDETVIPAALEALGKSARFNPSPDACRWCPAAGQCRAQLELATQQDFGTNPDLLEPGELGEILGRLKFIRQWADQVENVALDTIYSKNVPIPGWKVVLSGGRRGIPDAAAAIQTLIDAGWKAEQVARFSVRPLGELEKLVGAKDLTEILGSLIVKSTGKPSLVHESDNRPSVSPETEAKKVFSDA